MDPEKLKKIATQIIINFLDDNNIDILDSEWPEDRNGFTKTFIFFYLFKIFNIIVFFRYLIVW